MTNGERLDLMKETALELAATGLDMGVILRQFARVDEFAALVRESHPMCKALTTALIGRTLFAGGVDIR